MEVKCQDERSQHKNYDRAMRILRSRLYERQQQDLHNQRAEARRTLIGSGDRSERIRTYNYPQNRLTDHRINLTLYKLDAITAGNLQDVIQALKDFDKKQRLESGGIAGRTLEQVYPLNERGKEGTRMSEPTWTLGIPARLDRQAPRPERGGVPAA